MSVYEKQTWVDGVTPADAEHFNHMEEGIAANAEAVGKVSEGLADLKNKPIPEETVKTAVDEYIAKNNGGFATAEDINRLNEEIGLKRNTIDLVPLSTVGITAYIESNGVFGNSTSWDSRIVNVASIPDDYHVVVRSGGLVLSRFQIAFYSAETPTNETFISGIPFDSGVQIEGNLRENIITSIPDGALSMMITNYNIDGDEISITAIANHESSRLDEIYGFVDHLDYDYETVDLLQFSYDGPKCYVENGIMTGSTSWNSKVVPKSKIPDFEKITVTSYGYADKRTQIAFYSTAYPSNESYLSGVEFGRTTVSTIPTTNYVYNIPAGALSMMVTNLSTSGDVTTISALSSKKTTTADRANENIAIINKHILEEQRARFDERFNFIAYSASGASSGSANTEEHYLWGATHKFTAIKGDVQATSDGKIVMCHDNGFTLNSDGDIISYSSSNNTRIDTLTEAQCLNLKHATTQQYVCGIDSLIRVCKLYGKIAYITLRDSHMDQILPELFKCLDMYNMRKRTIINSFYLNTLKQVRLVDDDIMLSFTQTFNHKLTSDDIDKADSFGNCLICCYDYGDTGELKATNQDDAVIAYAKSKGIRLHEAIIAYDTDLNADELYKRGFVGAQIARLPGIFEQ